MARFTKSDKDDEPVQAVTTRTPKAAIVESKCSVCQSPHRALIDKNLMLGVISGAEIARLFSKVDGVNYSRQTIHNHKKNHLSLKEAAHLRMLEKLAEQEGREVDTLAETLLTKRGLLQSMVNKGYEDMMVGKTTVFPSDMMTALDRLERAELEHHQSRVETLQSSMEAEMQAFIEAVKTHVPTSLMNKILKDYRLSLQEMNQQQRELEIEQGQDAN